MLPPATPDRVPISALHDLRIIRHAREVIPPPHQPPMLALPPVNIRGEDLYHVLLGVRGLRGRAAVAVGGHVDGLLRVEQAQDVAGQRGVDNGRRDQLVHGLVVGGVRRVVHEAGAAGVDAAGEEGHADGFVVRDALEGADEVGAFEVLEWGFVSGWESLGDSFEEWESAYLAFVRPHVTQLVEHFDLAERT